MESTPGTVSPADEFRVNTSELVFMMFNQYVFSEAKMNIALVKKYYQRKKRYLGVNELLLGLVETVEYNSITEPLIGTILTESGYLSQDEVTDIVNLVKFNRTLDRSQVAPFLNILKGVCYSAFMMGLDFQKDPVGAVEKIQDFGYQSNHGDQLVARRASEIDITDMVDAYVEGSLRSRYDFINRSYSTGGYLPGQIVMIVAAPGTGKSLFLQSEALNFVDNGKRVHYIALGELDDLKILIRLTCMALRKPQYQVEADILGNVRSVQPRLSNLYITCVPSGSVSSREYVDWIMKDVDSYDVLMVDYDGNFRATMDDMYKDGGQTYDALTELSRRGKLVMVASQLKQAYYDQEFLGYSAVAESSRKVQLADMIITIGRNRTSSIRCGAMNIAKSRSGSVGSTKWVGTSDGLFMEVNTAEYVMASSMEREVTYDEMKMHLTVEEVLNGNISQEN